MHGTASQPLWNALTESFCIHARNLKMFVINDRGVNKSCVVARDFVEFGRKVPPNLTGAFQRINEQIAHLTRRRVVNPNDKFDLDDARRVHGWLIPAMKEFAAALDEDGCKRWNSAAREKEKFQLRITSERPSTTNAIRTATVTTVTTDQIFRIVP
jgi:hypothetical protein